MRPNVAWICDRMLPEAVSSLDWWIWLVVGIIFGLGVQWLAETLIFRRQLVEQKIKADSQLADCQAELSRARLNFERMQVQSTARSSEFSTAIQARNSLQAALDAREQEVASLNAQLNKARADYMNRHRSQSLLEKKLADAQAQLKYLQNTLDTVHRERTALLAQVNNFQEDATSMTRMIKDLQKDRENLARDTAQLRSHMESTQTAAHTSAGITKIVEAELHETPPGKNGSAPPETVLNQVQVLREQLTALQTEHDAAQSSKAEIEKHLAGLRAQYAASLHDLNDWRSRFDELDKSHQQDKQENDGLRDQLAAMTAQNDQLRAGLSTLDSQVQSATTAAVQALEEDKRKLSAQLEKARFDLDALRATRAAIEIEHDKANQRLVAMQNQLDDSTTKAAMLSQQIRELETSHAAADNARSAIEKAFAELNFQYQAALRELASLRTAHTQLEQEDRREKVEREALLQQIATLTQDGEKAINALNTLSMERSDLAARFANLSDELGLARARYQTAYNDYTAIAEELAMVKYKHGAEFAAKARVEHDRELLEHELQTMREQLDTLQTDFSARLDERVRESSELNQRLTASICEREQVIIARDQLENELAELGAQFENLSQMLETLRGQLASQQAKHETVVSERSRLADQLNSVQAQLIKLETDSAALQNDKDALAREVGTLQSQLDVTTAEFTLLRVQNDSSLQELSRVRSEHSSAIEDISALQTQNDTTAQELTRLRAEHESAVEQLTTSRAQNDASIAELARLRGEHESAREQLTAVHAKHQAALDELSALHAQHESTAARLSRLQTQNDSTVQELMAVRAENDAAAQRLVETQNQRENIERSLNDLHQQFVEKERAYAELQNEQRTMLEQLAVARGMEQERAELTAQLDAAQSDLAALREQLAALKSQLEAADRANTTLQTELDALRTKLDSVRAELDASNTARVATEQELNTFKNQVAQLRPELENAVRSRGAIEQALGITRDRVRDLDRDVKRERAQRDSYLDQIATLTSGANATAQTIRELQRDKDDLASQLYEIRTLYAELQADVGTNRSKPFTLESSPEPPATDKDKKPQG